MPPLHLGGQHEARFEPEEIRHDNSAGDAGRETAVDLTYPFLEGPRVHDAIERRFRNSKAVLRTSVKAQPEVDPAVGTTAARNRPCIEGTDRCAGYDVGLEELRQGFPGASLICPEHSAGGQDKGPPSATHKRTEGLSFYGIKGGARVHRRAAVLAQ